MISFSKENSSRWYEACWWLCVVTLPLPDTFNNGSIILLAVVWLFDNQLFKNPQVLKVQWWAWPFLLYFVWTCVGLIYSQDIENGFFTLEKKISFWALPIIAVTGKQLRPLFISFLKRSFVYVCFSIIVLCIAVSIYSHIKGNATSNFDFNSYSDFMQLHPDSAAFWSQISYIQLVQWAGLHPTYFSMYLVFCLMILFTETYSSKKESIIHIGMGYMLGIFVALLSSRAAIIAFLFSVGYLVFIRIYRRESTSLLPVLSVSVLLLLSLLINPISRFRLLEEPAKTSYKLDTTTTRWNSVNYRLLEWGGSWSIIKQNYLLGVGTGGWHVAMTTFYSHFNQSTVGLEHNAHNQYLQTWMENGLLGLLLFLSCMGIPFLYMKPSVLNISFLLIFSLMCLTESIGERQKGIVFFTMFQTLFLGLANKRK